MGEPTSCCRSDGGYCDRCDLLLGLEGLRVVAVDRDKGDDGGGALTVTVESAPGVMITLVDLEVFGQVGNTLAEDGDLYLG